MTLLTACTGRPSAPSPHHNDEPANSRLPATTGSSSSPDVTLPLSQADLSTAIRLATGFAAAYATYSYTEPPQTYLARLKPMTTPDLYATLTRAAATPGILSSRTHSHETATAQAAPEMVRTISPSSLILIVNVRQSLTNVTGHRQHLDHLAVTATKTNDNTWLISDIEPAAAGDDSNESTFHAPAP